MLINDRLRQGLNATLIPLAVLSNVLVQLQPQGVGDVSRQHETLLMAAGWAFAIWGPLFLLQLGYAVFQALPSQRMNPALRRIGGWTALSAICFGAWPFIFTAGALTAAWVILVVNLAALIAVEVQLGDAAREGREAWLIRVPFALLLGWISVATILQTAQWLRFVAGWRGAPATPLFWSVALVLVAAALAVVMGVMRKSPAFVAAVSWALAGVAAHTLPQSQVLAVVAAVCAAGLAALVIGELVAMALGKFPIDLEGRRRLV